MAYSSKSSQEKRRGFIDPRTKLALILVLAVFVMGGLGGAGMQPVRMVLSALPFVLLLAERQWMRFLRGICMLVCGYAMLWAIPYLPAGIGYLALMCGGILEYKGRRFGRKERQKLCYLVMQDTGNQLFTESVLEEILLLDEPTSGLDHRHMKETAALLKKLQEMGTTILVVTHDIELIRSCCSRMITKRNICQAS